LFFCKLDFDFVPVSLFFGKVLLFAADFVVGHNFAVADFPDVGVVAVQGLERDLLRISVVFLQRQPLLALGLFDLALHGLASVSDLILDGLLVAHV